MDFQLIKSFTDSFGYVCNIDYIEKSNYDHDIELENVTVITTHFINEENNLPVSADCIILYVIKH